jgi:hypothetical protein
VQAPVREVDATPAQRRQLGPAQPGEHHRRVERAATPRPSCRGGLSCRGGRSGAASSGWGGSWRPWRSSRNGTSTGGGVGLGAFPAASVRSPPGPLPLWRRGCPADDTTAIVSMWLRTRVKVEREFAAAGYRLGTDKAVSFITLARASPAARRGTSTGAAPRTSPTMT